MQVKLSHIENMDLTTKRGHLTIKLLIHGDSQKVSLLIISHFSHHDLMINDNN